MNLNAKRALIVGFGKSGKSAYNLLKKQGCEVLIYDAKIKNSKYNLDGKFDFAVVSPGVKPKSEAIAFLNQSNTPVLSEVELGLLFVKSDNIIGITGTNGKTTCVSLLQHILRSSGRRAIACGNNGVCVTEVCEKIRPGDAVIVELSSFMLKSAKNLHLKFACLLNLQPDHLDYHTDLNDYYSSKKNIFNFQNLQDRAILNADDEEVSREKTIGETFYFSTKKQVEGVFVKGDYLYFKSKDKCQKLFSKKESQLLGEFNLSNLCACVLIAKLMRVSTQKIKEAVKTFVPAPHRLNLVYDGKFKVFNDSKATNVASTLASLSCFLSGVILILGGSDKGENFDPIFKEIKGKVKKLVITGGNAKKLKYYCIKNDYDNFIVKKSFKKAIKTALKQASWGDVVLFSPACASFDFFKNFEERGEKFVKIVEGCVEKK